MTGSVGALGRYLLVLVFLALLPGWVMACELSMGWEPWEPYQFKNEKGELKGLDVELMQLIMKRMDCRLRFEEMPWKRHLKEVEAGGVDLAAGADRTEERAAYARFSKPYRKETVQLFVRKGEVDDYDLKSLEDIPATDFVLGISAGYHYGDAFEKHRENKAFREQLQDVRSDENNYRKLKAGRIDGFLADRVALAASVKGTQFEGEFEAYPLEIKSDDIHVMFSRKSTSESQLQEFDDALDAVRDSSAYRKIMQRYTEL